ncbi:MAG TPA: GNAT family protein [Acidimicrobiales bacterium]|nr:GNAT family protein [Acidimicrobiales bacterium]
MRPEPDGAAVAGPDDDASSSGRAAGASRTDRPPRELPSGPLTLCAFAGDEGAVLNRLVVANLEHLRPWMPWAKVAPTVEENVEFVRRSVEEWDHGANFGFWLREDSSGQMVGCAGLLARIGPGGMEIGYWVAEDRTRRGYATASARALTSAAFGLRGIERVEIHCDEANLASAAVPRRLGFRLARVDRVPPDAPSEAGRQLVFVVDAASWVRGSS